jgi:hypothetical protein
MSIMPEGGWTDQSPIDSQQRPDANQRTQHVHPLQSGYTPRRSYLTCKICDSGTLSSKKIFRMSGPAVAIGFILLIPSIFGMIASALMLVGAINIGENESTAATAGPNQSYQSTFDANFRQSCAKSFRQNYYLSAGIPASSTLTEQYCECTLSTFKQTGSETNAAQTCIQRSNDGTIGSVGPNVDALYSGVPPRESQDGAATSLARFFGVSFSVVMGISSFVGGLLGWLLVMRKRVLQCDVCGAVVNAS